MIIDSHKHFWNYDPEKDGWITDDMKRIQQYFLPGKPTPIFNTLNINGPSGQEKEAVLVGNAAKFYNLKPKL